VGHAAGRLANNTNLGAKGIIALQAFGSLCDAANAGTLTNCSAYRETAASYAKVWLEHAYNSTGGAHYQMSYNPVPGVSDSWSIKYNLLWQRLLRLDGPFDYAAMAEAEVAYYMAHANRFGIPLDPRHTYVKTDWLAWAAAMANASDAARIHGMLFDFANQTRDRNPFTDLYDTVSGNQTWISFIARPVVGGLFAALLL